MQNLASLSVFSVSALFCAYGATLPIKTQTKGIITASSLGMAVFANNLIQGNAPQQINGYGLLGCSVTLLVGMCDVIKELYFSNLTL